MVLASCFLTIAYRALAQETPASLSDQDEAANYLSAFKQRAIDAAFDSGARVKGVAYIDGEGRLHERTMFSSEADVRGVQIDSYLEAMGGEASLDAVQVSEDARCQLWTGKGSNSGLVAIRLTSGQASEASESALRREEERRIITALQRSLSASGFRVLAPTGPKPDSYQDTTYARALVGDWSEGPEPDFSVAVSVRMLADDREENDIYINHPGLASIVYVISSTAKPVRFAVMVTFSQPAAARAMGDFRALIETGAYRALESGEWVMEQDEDDLDDWVAAATEEFTQATHCLPRVFKVRRDGPERFSVDAGRSRGVAEGTWLLVGDRQLMVNNVVSDMTLDTLVMLRVVRADDHRALAEPLPSGLGALVSQGELLGTLP